MYGGKMPESIEKNRDFAIKKMVDMVNHFLVINSFLNIKKIS